MQYKSIKLLLWAIFALVMSLYMTLLNRGTVTTALAVLLLVAAVVLAFFSWIVGYISDEDKN